MNEVNWKNAFGETPESVEFCVRRALRGRPEETKMKRKLSLGVCIALLVLALACGMAVAASYGVLDFLSFTDGDGKTRVNEALSASVQTVGEMYDGQAVRMEVSDALYDREGGVFTIAWTLQSKTPQDKLYVVCEGLSFDGEEAFARSYSGMTEFFLSDEAVSGGVTGELPLGGGTHAALSFRMLKPLREVVEVGGIAEEAEASAYQAQIDRLNAEGKIVMAGDGMIELEWGANGETYAEALLASGKFEEADAFTLSFDLRDDTMDGLGKTYAGPEEFTFGDYALRVRRAEMTPMSATFEVEYITDVCPEDGGKGMGPMWELDFAASGQADDYWYNAAGGEWSEPVRTEDGRWSTVFTFNAIELHTMPDEIVMTLVTYQQNGEELLSTRHDADAVTLRFAE